MPRKLLRSWFAGYACALAAVALVSLFIGVVLGQVNLANASMLYLLAVMATAVGFGRGPAVFASIVAFLVFDWFFVQPLHQFTVSDPEEWVSLLFFLLTATLTGQLAAGQRQRAREAQQRRREGGRDQVDPDEPQQLARDLEHGAHVEPVRRRRVHDEPDDNPHGHEDERGANQSRDARVDEVRLAAAASAKRPDRGRVREAPHHKEEGHDLQHERAPSGPRSELEHVGELHGRRICVGMEEHHRHREVPEDDA
jgi:hypothetical protein